MSASPEPVRGTASRPTRAGDAGDGAVWAGIDLGGTGTRIVVADELGECAGATVATAAFMAPVAGHPDQGSAHGQDGPVASLAADIRALLPPGRVLHGIGIGASGPVDLRTGLIDNPDTLPAFTGPDVVGGLSRLLGVPARIDNDAVVAGLAEHCWGAARGVRSLLCVTLGTGVGVVILADGWPVRAADGSHPEAGHIGVPGSGGSCYCGLAQCWEQVASRTALDRMRATWTGSAEALWAAYAQGVGSGLITLLTLYRPSAVVLGGSVAQQWPWLERPLRAALATSREVDPTIAISASTLGERAGALGATILPRREIGFGSG